MIVMHYMMTSEQQVFFSLGSAANGKLPADTAQGLSMGSTCIELHSLHKPLDEPASAGALTCPHVVGTCAACCCCICRL